MAGRKVYLDATDCVSSPNKHQRTFKVLVSRADRGRRVSQPFLRARSLDEKLCPCTFVSSNQSKAL